MSYLCSVLCTFRLSPLCSETRLLPDIKNKMSDLITIRTFPSSSVVTITAIFGSSMGLVTLNDERHESPELFIAACGCIAQLELEAFDDLLRRLCYDGLCELLRDELDPATPLDHWHNLNRGDLLKACRWHFGRRPAPVVQSRAARALSTLTGLDESGDGAETALVDLLTNAMHLYGVVCVRAHLRVAEDHFSSESEV